MDGDQTFLQKEKQPQPSMQMDNQLPPKKVPGLCSFRYGLAFLLHCCNVMLTAQYTSLSLTMVAMVNSSNPPGVANFSASAPPANVKNPVYNWSPEIQGIIFSSIIYGMALTPLPVGYFSVIYSARKIVGSAFFFSSLFFLFIPLAADLGEIGVIVCRLIQGLAQGTVMTAQHAVWVKWAPPLERGRLISISASGILLGPFIVLLLTGFICQSLGWPMVYYIFGASGCALTLLWFILVYDDPKDHPYMSVSEKEYIMSSVVQQFSSSRQSLPIKAMLKSRPLWVISFSSFAFSWTNTIVTLYMPTFVNSMLHVNITENGLLSALPHLFAWICGILTGYMTDFLQSRNILRVITIRKLFTTLSLLLPSFFSVCLLYLSSTFLSSAIFLILIRATGGFATGGINLNALDIAPRYYAFLRGVTSVTAMTGGLIGSTLTGIIINQDPESSWYKTFFLMSAISVVNTIFYLIFAKAEIQDWAKDRQQTHL
ncbi:sodium-dependent phosphate transport protein 1 [Tamandua tetradactyla]|uniref:sodium-dependent phosphate transport protein 1 n=1 Tax=Tamandua tetradactyla TaxID=48850 RepID=UPI0040538989